VVDAMVSDHVEAAVDVDGSVVDAEGMFEKGSRRQMNDT
jgi:hypothetical protein